MNLPNVPRDGFIELVRQALGQLHNRALLRGHPLATVLAGSETPLTGEELHEALSDVLRELRPVQTGSQQTAEWRRYRHLWLRYVEGMGPLEISELLGVTDRQARRDHREGLESVAAMLWTRYRKDRWPLSTAVERGAEKTESPWPKADDAALVQELSRLSSQLPTGPTSVVDILQGSLRTVTRLLESRQLTVVLMIPTGLPPVAVNPIMLRQLVLSVLGYVAHESMLVHDLRIEATLSGQAVHLRFVFRRPPSGTEARSSPIEDETIPPLALARQMAESGGTELTVATEADGCQTIQVLLPVAPMTTILVIDDNLDFLRLCQRSLEGRSYRVYVANLPSDALRLAQEVQPDLIVLDVLMPSNDGWDLLALLREDATTRSIPVIICSVLPEPNLALELGADGFLTKPVTPTSLLAALERFAPRRSARSDPPPGRLPAR